MSRPKRSDIAAFAAATAIALALGCSDDAPPAETCGFGEAYLPAETGNSWSFRVTDLGDGARSNKTQWLETTDVHPEYGEVVLQVTEKDAGRTDSLLGHVGDRLIRYEQRDFDLAGTLERTTVYDPGFLRLDESADHLEPGAMFTEQYTETTTDLVGTVTVARTDEWEVLGVDVECNSPMGDFSCLHVRRRRVAGGVADKQFYYARGVGKVREVGTDVIEELTECGPME